MIKKKMYLQRLTLLRPRVFGSAMQYCNLLWILMATTNVKNTWQKALAKKSQQKLHGPRYTKTKRSKFSHLKKVPYMLPLSMEKYSLCHCVPTIIWGFWFFFLRLKITINY